MAVPRMCIYCSEPARRGTRQGAKDCAIPVWVARFQDVEPVVLEYDRAIGGERVKTVPIDDYAGLFMCGRCDRALNQKIEAPAADLVKRLLKGERRGNIFPAEQELLSSWSAKIVYAIWGRMEKQRGVAVAHRRYLVRTGRVHPGVYVSASRTTGDRLRVIFSRRKFGVREGGIDRWYYDCVVDLAGVAFRVFGAANGALRSRHYQTPTSLAVRLAPGHGSVAQWPPARVLDDDDLARLAEHDPRFGTPLSAA